MFDLKYLNERRYTFEIDDDLSEMQAAFSFDLCFFNVHTTLFIDDILIENLWKTGFTFAEYF